MLRGLSSREREPKYTIQANPQDSSDSEVESWHDLANDNHENHHSNLEIHADSAGSYDQEQNSTFEYGPIESATHVRLLRVRKATRVSVEGSLKVVPIEKLPNTTYFALSYTWGRAQESKDVKRIELGGKDFWIRNNLWNFFVYAGKLCLGHLLYVDAICVDQNDKEERSHQVKNMAIVYENANCVYAWLGRALPQQTENLKALHELIGRSNWRNSADPKEWSREAMFGFEALMARPYWSRLWIVQEFLLPEQLKIVCGTWQYDWDELAKWRKDVPEPQLDPSTKLDWWNVTAFEKPQVAIHQQDAEDHFSGRWEHAIRIFTHRSNWNERTASGIPLYKAVKYFNKQDCGEIKDRIFALIRLLEKSERRGIEPSYEDSIKTIYEDSLSTGLLCLQRDKEPEALKDGRYPKNLYEQFASSLRDLLKLEDESVLYETSNAFKNPKFRERFIANCRAESGASWDHRRREEIETSIERDFFALTQDNEVSRRKVFKLHLAMTGKRHLASAALVAARAGMFKRKAFIDPSGRQGNLFLATVAVQEALHVVTHFRKWNPFGN